MNELNYASLEASKKLVDAGIVLETDCIWCQYIEGFRLIAVTELHPLVEVIPAPCFTDVWKELPEEYCKNATDQVRYKVFMSSQVGYHSGGKDGGIWIPYKGNPADALIDLLVWLKGEGK